MATSFNKTYSITLQFSYEPAATITDADLHAAELRAKIIDWIESKVAHVQQGNLNAHIVGSVSEA